MVAPPGHFGLAKSSNMGPKSPENWKLDAKLRGSDRSVSYTSMDFHEYPTAEMASKKPAGCQNPNADTSEVAFETN